MWTSFLRPRRMRMPAPTVESTLDHYVEWFLPYAKQMLAATAESGNLVINIKNRVANRGALRGQRHPYVYQLVLAMQDMGWRWIETYIWAKPNAVPGRFGPRTKDWFEYVYHFAKGTRPYFDLDAVRVPYKADAAEIARRNQDGNGRKTTEAGFGRDRTKTYLLGGADPGNVDLGASVLQPISRRVAHSGDARGIGRVLHSLCEPCRWPSGRPIRRQRYKRRCRPAVRPTIVGVRTT